MMDHPVNVFKHITASHFENLMFFDQSVGNGLGPGVQGLQPILHGAALVFTNFIEVVQGKTRL